MLNTQAKSQAWLYMLVTPELQNHDLAGHQPTSRIAERPCLRGNRQRVFVQYTQHLSLLDMCILKTACIGSSWLKNCIVYVNFLKRHALFGLIFSLLSYTFSCVLFCQLVRNTIFRRPHICDSIGEPYDRDEKHLRISDLLGKHCHVDYKAYVFSDNTHTNTYVCLII